MDRGGGGVSVRVSVGALGLGLCAWAEGQAEGGVTSGFDLTLDLG